MTSPVTMLPPGYRRVKVLTQSLEYAREVLPAGATAVVDDATAARWLRAKLAVEADPEPAVTMTRTSCPKCGSALEYATLPTPEERWTQCGNPACGHGWLR